MQYYSYFKRYEMPVCKFSVAMLPVTAFAISGVFPLNSDVLAARLARIVMS